MSASLIRFPKSDLHTHTNFCDGKNTPEEMVLAACEKGMDTLGFSGHSYVHFDLDCCMTREETEAYRREILRLRAEYADRLHILLGLEQDFYADDPAVGYDYVIGSVHYLPADGEYVPLDLNKETLRRLTETHFGGDIYGLLRRYFETVAQVRARTGCNIVGHFDLMAKFNDGGALFDESDPRYLRAGMEALSALVGEDVLFEINTGARSRGYRRCPYPAQPFLKYLAEHGARLILSSDSHSASNLLYGFEDAAEYAEAAGVDVLFFETKEGLKEVRL